jgi:hypothetical protein
MKSHHVTQRADVEVTIVLGENFPELLNAVRRI